ncbi:MAG: DNA-binding protein [Catenulispora sp. 13_1_20CM_3_70_7]|jgi:hemolysin III|nr:hemolysin III family protein [Catenulisporales bacterium]OLE26828.1 MAG: DNA-binding protein [Catenulispora sp. 13_1_20CM_3_70_7]
MTPPLVEAVSNAVAPVKPKLRGWLHLCMAPLALAAGIVLIALADSGKARVASAIFAFSAVMLFGTSALYHRGNWGRRGEAILQRLDHANIFLIIAGTYTPFTVLLLHGTAERALLYTVWIGASAGIAFRVFWMKAPRWIYTPCYVALGWAAVFFLPQFLHSGGVAILVMMVVGGVLYSIGALVYGTKRPDFSPRWFGFHEVFHSLTVAAFALHFIGVSLAAM